MLGIYAIVLLGALSGVGLFVHGYAESKKEEGRAECRQAIADATDKANKAASALTAETQHHIEDMTTAYQQGEKEASARVVYVTKKGASDVAAHPEVFGNAACTLPADALRNLNAARAGLRRDVPADVVTAQPAATPNPAAADRDKRPLGKRK